MLSDFRFPYEITDFDRTVFDRFVPVDHPLVRAVATINWDAFQERLLPYYSANRGQPAIDPLRMLKLEFLKYRFNLSDNQVVTRVVTDLSFRYFLQVGFRFQPPDSSSMTRFRARLGEQGFAEVFDVLVVQAREAGLVKDRLRLKDASHVVANIAVQSTLVLVAQIRDRLLKTIEPFDAEWVTGQRIEIELLRQRTREQQDESRLMSRVTHLQELVAWAETQTTPPNDSSDPGLAKAWEKFQQTLKLAQKILQDREPKSNRKTRSVSDPEARRGKHGEFYDGYLVDILVDADSEIITQIQVLEAGGDEARDAVELVRAEHAAHGNQIENLSIDGIGFNGEALRALEGAAESSASEGADAGLGVTTFVPPKPEPVSDLFSSHDFKKSEDGQTVTCPAGETSAYRHVDTVHNAVQFRFSRAQCDACPLVAQCIGTPHKGVFGRSVAKNDYEAEYERARQRAQTSEFQQVRREHPAVERKLNELMNHHGGRRARYWGRAKVRIQQLMTGMVVNAKRMVTLLGPVRAEVAMQAAASSH